MDEDYQFDQKFHPIRTMNRLSKFRESSYLCDTTLVVGGMKIPCHRIILAAESPFFK